MERLGVKGGARKSENICFQRKQPTRSTISRHLLFFLQITNRLLAVRPGQKQGPSSYRIFLLLLIVNKRRRGNTLKSLRPSKQKESCDRSSFRERQTPVRDDAPLAEYPAQADCDCSERGLQFCGLTDRGLCCCWKGKQGGIGGTRSSP